MKKIKSLILIFILMIISFFGISSAKALDITENDIINYIVPKIQSKYPDFDFKTYRNLICFVSTSNSNNLTCYFFSNNDLDKITAQGSRITTNEPLDYYYALFYRSSNTSINISLKTFTNYMNFFDRDVIYLTPNFMDGFDTETKILLDFSDYFGENEESKEELEIMIKATEVLDLMLDKTKNIYEVLINNQIFKLCLGVLLSYLIFIFLYKIFKD